MSSSTNPEPNSTQISEPNPTETPESIQTSSSSTNPTKLFEDDEPNSTQMPEPNPTENPESIKTSSSSTNPTKLFEDDEPNSTQMPESNESIMTSSSSTNPEPNSAQISEPNPTETPETSAVAALKTISDGFVNTPTWFEITRPAFKKLGNDADHIPIAFKGFKTMRALEEFIAEGELWKTLKSYNWTFKRVRVPGIVSDVLQYRTPLYNGHANKNGTDYLSTDIEVARYVRRMVQKRIAPV